MLEMTDKRGWVEPPRALSAAMPHPSTHNLYIAIAGLLFVALLLISCSGEAQQTTVPSVLSVSYTGALSVEDQLAAGSLLLEETDMAIDSAQASQLLTLWQAYRSLSNSDTSAQVEIDAVIAQIQGTMSAEQIEAIRAMGLTSDDLTSVVQQYAASAQAPSASTSSTSSSTEFGPGAFAGGGAPGPGGGDGLGLLASSAGQGTILSAASTEVPSQSLTAGNRSGDRAALRLVDSLIALLEAKADA
jgi:hypothetical protein